MKKFQSNVIEPIELIENGVSISFTLDFQGVVCPIELIEMIDGEILLALFHNLENLKNILYQFYQSSKPLKISCKVDRPYKSIKLYQLYQKSLKNFRKPLKAYISANNFHLNLVKFFNLNVLGRTR